MKALVLCGGLPQIYLMEELKRCEGIVKIGSVIVDNADLKLRAYEMAGNNQNLIPKLMRDPERLS